MLESLVLLGCILSYVAVLFIGIYITILIISSDYSDRRKGCLLFLVVLPILLFGLIWFIKLWIYLFTVINL